MADDVLLNKAAAIERAVARVREEHAGDDANLLANQTRQDAILNLQRACETSIDAAMHVVRIRRLGIPQETREAFDLLERAGLLDPVLSGRLKRMPRRLLAFRPTTAASLTSRQRITQLGEAATQRRFEAFVEDQGARR